MPEPQNPMEGRPAGWYPDPSGVHKHLAYWDGEGWTGETADPTTKRITAGRVILYFVLAVIGIAILGLITVSIAGDEVSEILSEIEEDLEEGASAQRQSGDGWVVHIDQGIGYEMSYPDGWQLRGDSDLESSDLSIATAEQVAEVFKSKQPSTSPMVLLLSTARRPALILPKQAV